MAHAAAPLHPGDPDVVAAAQVIDVTNISAGLHHVHSLKEGVVVATGEDDPVYAMTVGLIQHLLDDVALPVVDDVCGAIGLGSLCADRAGANGKEPGRAPQSCAGHSHKTHRTNANHANGVAKLNVSQFHTVEASGDHVAEHDCRGRIQALRQKGEVCVGLVDMEILRKDAVFEVGELPSGQHAARMHGISGLCFQAAPVGGDGRNDDPVAWFQGFDQVAHLYDFAHCFVA